MSNYARMLIERLSKPTTGRPLRPDQIGLAYIPGAESVRGCETMAYFLFMLIRAHHGERTARRIFAIWGNPPTSRRLRLIANMGLLDRLDMMKPRPNMQRLARELAEENKKRPRSQQHGAGSTNPIALRKQIKRVRDLRAKRMKNGTWSGPFPVAE